MKGRGERAESQTEKTTRGQAGNPRFLELVLKCVELRCKILGIEPPAKAGDHDKPEAVVEILEFVEAPARALVDPAGPPPPPETRYP
jgi:hypothetical protein